MLARISGNPKSLLRGLLVSFAMGSAAALGFIACGGGSATVQAVSSLSALAAALVTYQSRQPTYNDFIRLIFGNFTPTTLGGPNAYRVFFGATSFYEPPITVAQIADFSGIPVNTSVALIALRCIPQPGSAADPVLVTWPNLIAKMLIDYQTPGNTPAPNSLDEAIFTLAGEFSDTTSVVADEPLYNTLELGKQFFEPYPFGAANPQFTAAQMQSQMSTRFGTYPAFSGLGFTVENTATGPSLTSAEVMSQMMTPEYVLKNVSLAAAQCSCIIVPQGAWASTETLDPNYIERAGKPGGACVQVPDLGSQ